MALPFPNIDPVAISIGPIDIRWYALAYIAGFILGLYVIKKLIRKYPSNYLDPDMMDDLMTWVIIGVILGGRIGYVLFYNIGYYIENPLDTLKIWQGGMAFHGGLIGVITAMILFGFKKSIPFFIIADRVAVVTPIGLFFGRIANFINGELYGRTSDLPWDMIFVDGEEARHPSQVYQALTEGVILFLVLFLLHRFDKIRNRPGIISAAFLSLYAFMRFFIEYTRQPDAHIGFVIEGFSMGQILCIPMLLAGMAIYIVTQRNRATP